jgi:CHAT domain-containing protein
MTVLQWCPTGHFTFLPIHAAGCYDNELAIDCAPDYFISSYTPTIGALLTLDSAPTTQPFQMMAVIQSKELPSTRRELENIRRHVSCEALVELGVPEVPAGVEAVASRLSNVSIVHFACHGKQDPRKPLDSGLKLDDGLLRISRIMKEKIPNGSLAFLCACETAMGDQNLPDEAMSIGASLIFSGFRRVVATMW